MPLSFYRSSCCCCRRFACLFLLLQSPLSNSSSYLVVAVVAADPVVIAAAVVLLLEWIPNHSLDENEKSVPGTVVDGVVWYNTTNNNSEVNRLQTEQRQLNNHKYHNTL